MWHFKKKKNKPFLACEKSLTITPQTLAVNINRDSYSWRGHYMLIKGVPLNIAALGEVLTRRVENKTQDNFLI